MAKYGVVAGDLATPLITNEILKDFSDIEITYTPFTMKRMIDDLSSTGGLTIRDLKAVLIIDFACDESDPQKAAEEFVAIQDLMHTNSLSDVTLYLVTRNSDLYEKLKGTVAGISGTYFEGTQIFIIKGDYTPQLIKGILQGERDNQDLYNKEAYHRKSKEQRIREDMEAEIESRRNLNQEYIDFDKTDPDSVISQKDYQDTAQRRQADEEKRKAQMQAEKDRQRNEKRNKTNKATKEEQQPSPRVKVNIQNKSQRKVTPSVSNNIDLVGLQDVFKNVKEARTEISIGKLETDKGIISIVGDYTAGASSIVANVADMYAIANRDVLIIDLDIENRAQTLYFNQYDKAVKEQQGTSDSLIEVVQGYDIKSTVVPVSKKVDILSISREDEVNFSWVDAVGGSLESILLEARRLYDIVILDIPIRLFPKYLKSLEEINRNLFVVENKYYKIESFFEHSLHPILLEEEYSDLMEEFIKKSNIVINMFERGRRDIEGNEINRHYLRELLDNVGYPYDRIGVAGEIPFYDKWEEQYFTGVRHVWRDSLALGVYKRVFGKVVI